MQLDQNGSRETVSILMTTYRCERAERLARSLKSIYGQTVSVDELVLVIDGPIDVEQEAVVTAYADDPRVLLKVIRLPKNVGLGSALAIGQEACVGKWIMRMDSDDVSLFDRTKAQLEYVREHPDVDLVGAWSEEFFENYPETRIKAAPLQQDELVRTLRWRNVIVHPSVMIRASTMRRVGGFRGVFPYLEDWDLFVRLAVANARLAVLPQVLIRVRASKDQSARRGGWRYVKSDVQFRIFCWRSGFQPFHEFAIVLVGYIGFRLVGSTMRTFLYRFVREKQKA